MIDVPYETWIPAARPDVIHASNVARLETRLVAEEANIPLTTEAERALAARGVVVLPDFIANAGGMICAAVEYRGGTERAALALIDEKIRANRRTRRGETYRCVAAHRGNVARDRARKARDADTALGQRVVMNCAGSMCRRRLAPKMARGLD